MDGRIYIALALVVVALILAHTARRMWLDWLQAQRDEEPPARPGRRREEPLDPEAEELLAAMREGPRNQELRDRERWAEERIAEDRMTPEDVQALLDSREPIVRL